MLKKILSNIRKLSVINYPVRVLIRSGYNLFDKLKYRWPVSGTISVKTYDVKLKLYNKCDDGFVHFFYYNLAYHENNILLLTDAFAKKIDHILDIGANTGIDSIIIAKRNPDIKIFAVEPYIPNYTRLEKNVALNGVENIILKKVALGNKEGQIVFYVPADGRITDVSSAVQGIGEKVYGDDIKWKESEVQQTTLDKIVDEIGDLQFFKCDVEGYEVSVFEGAQNFFGKSRPSFIVEIVLVEKNISYFNEFARRYNYIIYHIVGEGLVKINHIYPFHWRGDFLFTQYDFHDNFIPVSQFNDFVGQVLNTPNPG